MTEDASGPELAPGDVEGLHIELLGGFRVTVDGRAVEDSAWRLRKVAGLLKLLALAPRHQLHREQALEVLWPDAGPRAAANSLGGTLHALRRILASDGRPAWPRLHGDILTLGPPDRVWVDVQAFEVAGGAARRSRDPAAHYAALRLYTGELLPADRYEDWAVSRRERVRDLYLALLLGLARLHETRRELRAAIEILRRVVEEERAHEEAHVGLMRLYALSGQRHQALRQYGQLQNALRRELDAAPEAESERLYQQIRAGRFSPTASRPTAAPASETTAAPRHNLPTALTSFVGREDEVVEVGRLLAATRLLTLIGTGGCGKTRLALEVARDAVAEYADGVWLVELAGLADPRLVPRAIAGVLGVREDHGRPLVDALSDALRHRSMLLLLDNCEHLADECVHLVERLLSSCPDLWVLATSREVLGVRGELHWRVPSLSLPPAGPPLPVERLGQYGAVRLLMERARFRQPAIALTPENALAVLQICRGLEGIPLAIELAAARVPALPLEQIAARLDDVLGLLTDGGRRTAPRHKTLRGVFDWSYGLLGEAERRLFARLSVFAGGWDLPAAETVGGGADVLDLFSSLVDKSLVLAESGMGGTVRYRLLEPLRQYAREKLEERGEVGAISRQHAWIYVTLAEEAEPELVGPRQGEWLARLEVEHDNIRAALSWALRSGEVGPAARIAAALWRFWWVHGHLGEGREWLRRVLDAGELPPRVRARVLRAAGLLERTLSEFGRAAELIEQAVVLFRELGDKEGLSNATGNLGSILTALGEYERAKLAHEESLALGRELNDTRGVAVTLGDLALNYYEQGDYAPAMSYWEQSLPLSRESGDRHSLAITLNNLGSLGYYLGDLERSSGRLEQAVTLFRELDARATLAQSLQNLGDVRVSQGRHAEAASLLQESLTMARDLASPETIAYCLETSAKLAFAQARPKRAVTLLGAAEGVRAASGAALSPGSQASLQPILDAVHASLPEAVWRSAREEGGAMSVEGAIAYALSPPEPTPVEALSRREREIADLIAQGRTNRQIAEQLALSARTVDAHAANLMRKLGVRSRAQVAAWAAAQGSHPVE